MKLSSLVILLTATFCLSACSKQKPPIEQETGYVRSMWTDCDFSACYTDVVFEAYDAGHDRLITIPFVTVPPLWLGLNCKITYQSACDSQSPDYICDRNLNQIISVERVDKK